MNFGSGKTIPLGNGSPGFAGNGMTGGTGQPGGGIGGMGADGFGGQAPEFMGSGERPGEGAGFGEFGGDMEPGERQNLPFGVPEEDSAMTMGTEGREMDLGSSGVEDGPFGSVVDTGEDMPGGVESFGTEMAHGGVEPFGTEMGTEGMEPFGMEDGGMEFTGQSMGSGDMELDGDGIPMEGMNGLEDYVGMAGEDKDFGGMFEAAAGMEGEISGMSGEDFEPADMGRFGGSFDESMYGFSGRLGDFDREEAGYGEAAMDMAGIGTGNGHAAGSGSGQGADKASGMAFGVEGGMAGSSASGAGNMDGVVHGMPGPGDYGTGMPGAYRVERDGEGYMRYDAFRFERPQGEYQTIHENGKTFYELPETAKAPGILPETKVSLEKDGTLKLEKIYREQGAMPGSLRERAESGNEIEGLGEKEKPVGKQGVKQRGKGQRTAGNEGQSGRSRDQRNESGRK